MLDKLKNEGCYMSYLRNINVRWGCFDLTDVLKMRFKDDEVERYMIEKGDLVLCEGGEPGRCAIWDKANPIMFQKALHRIRCHGGVLNEYLKYVIEDYAKANKLEEYYTGSTIKHLTGESLVSILFPLPPIKEQERIVQEIQRYLSLVAIIENNKENLLAAIKQAKSKVLDLAIHGKLVPQDPNDEPAIELLKRINPKAEITCDTPQYGKLPKGWCETHIGDAFKVTMGQSPDGSSLNPIDGMEFHQGKILFGNKYLRKSSVLTNSPTKIADADTLLLCVRAPVGVVNITKQRICIGRGLCCLTPTKAINLDYAFYMLTTFQEKFESQSTGSTFKAISGSIIKNEQLWLPPLSEQHRIVAKIEELFAQLDKIEASL